MAAGPNQDQQLLIVEKAVIEKLRKHYRRKFAGFDAISRRTPQDNVELQCYFTTADFVKAAARKDVTAMKAHKMLCNLTNAGLIMASISGRWRPNTPACRAWAQVVIDSLHRCGLPFVDDLESMEAARLKANEARERRRALMRGENP